MFIVPGEGALCYLNGKQVTSRVELRTGSRLILGKSHVFRFNNPLQARQQLSSGEKRPPTDGVTDDVTTPEAAAPDIETVDWSFATSELLEKQGVDLKKEMDAKLKEIEEKYRKEKEESDLLFEQHRKVRTRALWPVIVMYRWAHVHDLIVRRQFLHESCTVFCS